MVAALVLAGVAGTPLPAFVVQPGPPFALAEVIRIDASAAGGQAPIDGDYLFLTIQLSDAVVMDVLRTAVDADRSLVTRSSVLGDEEEGAFIARQEALFDESLATAIAVGLDAVGSDLSPDAVRIEQEGVGGPSAGLLVALAVADLASPDDLAGGRLVTGTGAITPDGRVGPVGGVADKAVAASRAGATVFIAPAGLAEEARRAAPDLEVLAVETLADAVAGLRGSAGGTGGGPHGASDGG